MSRHFNTAGLCLPEDHYMIDPLGRLEDIRSLVDGKNILESTPPGKPERLRPCVA